MIVVTITDVINIDVDWGWKLLFSAHLDQKNYILYYLYMFEKIVQKLLNRVIGEYVEDFNSQNLNIKMWKGEVRIQNVRLRKEILKKLNIPINIKYSRLGLLKMEIPWTSLSSSKINVSIQGLQLLISEVPEAQWQCKNNKIIEHRKKQIQGFCDMIIADFAKKAMNLDKQKQEKQQGYLSNIVVRILDNIQIVVKDIHIRFEDHIFNRFSFGFVLEKLQIYTVNKSGEPYFVDRTKKQFENQPMRKKLILSNFGVYWNEKTQFYNVTDPHKQMMSSIFRKDSRDQREMNYLILMSFDAMLIQRESGIQFQEPEINLLIQFKELKLQIKNQQLQQIIQLGERLQKFTNEVKAQNRKKLTQLQLIANTQLFLTLFPKYFLNKCSAKELTQIQRILQKMETVNFESGIRKFLQEQQKQKMIQQKMKKSSGWFSGPKQLTEQQIKQIENYIEQNFGKDKKLIKRPQSFYYIKINFNLQILQVCVVNQSEVDFKQGVKLTMEEIKMKFNLREDGYMLSFVMNDISLDLYKQSKDKTSPHQVINLVRRIRPLNQRKNTQFQYVSLEIVGNPLAKKHLNQQITVRTDQLLIQFHPRIIGVIKSFTKIKLNSQNQEAALQAYGELKNKAATVANESLKKPFLKKSFISLDIRINAINFILFFDPMETEKDIWVAKLGEINIFSDSDVLKMIEFIYNQPMQKYSLSFKKLSFMHFENTQAYFMSQQHSLMIDKKQKVINELGIDFELELYKESEANIPKIKLKTVLHSIDILLSQFTYESIQKMGSCFTINEPMIKQQAESFTKAEVIKGAKKIGVIYEQSKECKKYFAVLNGSYLYFYKDKRDNSYDSYYYMKNCEIDIRNQLDPNKKAFEVKFANRVNELVLGFEKSQTLEEWVKSVKQIYSNEEQKTAIAARQQPPLIKKKSSHGIINPQKLNFQIQAKVEAVNINTLFHDDKQIKINLKDLNSTIKIHQAKNVLQFSLLSIQLSDNIYNYQLQQLNKLLISKIKEDQKLILISVLNYSLSHPSYDNIGVKVDVRFGNLVCNYKPETIERIMNFYVPKDKQLILKIKQKGQQLTKQEKQHFQQEKKRRKIQNVQNELKKGLAEVFSIQIRLSIKQIEASLINRNNRVMFARMGIIGFKYCLVVSTRGIYMKGSLKEIWFGDYSCYPDTIYQEQKRYNQVNYLIQTLDTFSKNMLQFHVKLLQLPDSKGKNMFVNTQICNIKASYIQQPVLRVITYLTEQILPSLTPPEDLTQVKQVRKNDFQPKQSTLVLEAIVSNIIAVVQPRGDYQIFDSEYLQLNVGKVMVTNKSQYADYILEKKNELEKVLTEVYFIQMKDIKISKILAGVETQLTNCLNFNISCELIQNSPYYRKVYKQRFDAGMRISCSLSPFVMSLNHDDYNFIMKCLYYNITYDDNAESYLFKNVDNRRQTVQVQHVSEPIYFKLVLEKIILSVTEYNFPLCILLLNQMTYDLTLDQKKMYMIFSLKHLYGTTIQKTSNEAIAVERGIFNAFQYEKQHKTKDLYNFNSFIKQFDRPEISIKDMKQNSVQFQMISNKSNGNSDINIKIKNIQIAIEIKTLLVLSKLAIIEDSIRPPEPTIKPLILKQKKQQKNGVMSINIQLSGFLGRLGDKRFENYIVMRGNSSIKLDIFPKKTEQQIIQLAKSYPINLKFLQSSNYKIEMNNYSLFFYNVSQSKKQRYLLRPINIKLQLSQSYRKFRDAILLQTELDARVSQMDKSGEINIWSTVKDMIILNKIIQDNLQSLTSFNNPKKVNQKNPNDISIVNEEVYIDKDALKNSTSDKIRIKSKGRIQLIPLKFVVINDCGRNYIPVLLIEVQKPELIYFGQSRNNQLASVFMICVNFFNPRSASWQPIVEKFKASFNYQLEATSYGSKSKITIAISGEETEEMSQVKVNISTQLISTLIATFEIANQEKKMLYQSRVSKEVVEMSPYSIQNKSIYSFKIVRKIGNKNEVIQIPPFFKSQLKMGDNGEALIFQYKGRKYDVSMEKFGYVTIPRVKDFHMQFKIQKLNRIVCFVDKITIKNSTKTQLYCIRYDQKKEKLQNWLQFKPQDVIPVKNEWFVQFSFNLKTFTPPCKISSLARIESLKSQSERFKFSINEKYTILDHKVISLRTPFIIHNCLPKDIKLQFICNGKSVSTRELQAQSTHQVFANQDVGVFKFKIITQGFYWSDEFCINHEELSQEKQLVLNDRQQGSTIIKYYFEYNQMKHEHRLCLFCPAFIISQLQQDIHVYGNFKVDQKNRGIEKYRKLGGQSQFWKGNNIENEQDRNIDKVTIVGTEVGSKLRICGSGCLIDFSEPFLINSIGVHQARAVVYRHVGAMKLSVFTILGIQIEPKRMSLETNIISKQIIVRYRYIVSNVSQFDFLIKEEGSQKLCFSVGPGEQRPFYSATPSIGSQSRNLVAKTPSSKQSRPLTSNSLGTTYFRLEQRNKKEQYKYFKIITQELKSYIFYQLSSVKYEDLPYQVIIKSNKFKVFVPYYNKELTKNSQPLLFISELPQFGFNIFMLINLIGTQLSEQVTVQADNFNFKQKIYFGNTIHRPKTICFVTMDFNDDKKIICIDQLQNQIEVPEHELQSINIKIDKLSFSFVQNHAKVIVPYQSFYIYMYNLQMILEKSNIATKYQARLQFIQIDQQDPCNIASPVILTPQKLKQYITSDVRQKPKWIFNMLVQTNNRFVKNVFFNKIVIQINNLVLRIETSFIKLVLKVYKEYTEDVLNKKSEFKIKRQIATWRKQKVKEEGNKTFIKFITIAPFILEICSQVRFNELQPQNIIVFGTIINALGVVITNIDNSPIALEGIKIDNCVDTVAGIQHKIVEHYLASIKTQIYKVFGSMNIIGNPISLFKNISTGIQAFKDKPSEGFVEGPLEFGRGIADGTTSLIVHSIGGALNSVEKVTGTIASGLAVLAFDPQFTQSREKQKMNKPRHVLQGLQKGGKAVLHGFKQGITGVITKPIEQVKTQGATGIFKGVAQGMTGLVVKPVTGIIDFASKTSEGLKNTALYFEDKPNEMRIRHPRVFYTECFVLREYQPIDSKILSIVTKTKYEQKYGFQSLTFITCYKVSRTDSEKYLLVLKQEIVMVEVEKEKISWVILLLDLILNRQSEEEIRVISQARRQWYKRNVNQKIAFENEQSCQQFIRTIEDLKANIKQNSIFESKMG